MTLSPTGDRLLWIDSRTNIYLYDTVTGANSVLFSLGEGEGRSIGPIAWNPVNDFVAIAAGSYADIYDVSNGTLSPSTSGATLIVSDAHRIVNLSWSPEGTRLATSHFFKSQLGSLGATLGAPEEASAIQVWDLAPGVIQTIPILKIDDRGGGNVSWSPDGARLAMLESGELLVYDFVARQVEADLQFDEEYPADVVWSPNVQFLATGGAVIRIWDTNTWEIVGTISAEARVRTLQWSPDGQFLFSDRGPEGLYKDAIPSDILPIPTP
jgi:WD40 repeat protein